MIGAKAFHAIVDSRIAEKIAKGCGEALFLFLQSNVEQFGRLLKRPARNDEKFGLNVYQILLGNYGLSSYPPQLA